MAKEHERLKAEHHKVQETLAQLTSLGKAKVIRQRSSDCESVQVIKLKSNKSEQKILPNGIFITSPSQSKKISRNLLFDVLHDGKDEIKMRNGTKTPLTENSPKGAKQI